MDTHAHASLTRDGQRTLYFTEQKKAQDERNTEQKNDRTHAPVKNIPHKTVKPIYFRTYINPLTP